MIEIIPAILEKSFQNIQAKIKELEPFFEKAQIDIGDGSFVPDKFGCINKLTSLGAKLRLEAHLMVKKPWQYIEKLHKAGFSKITFHYEAFYGTPKKTRAFAVNNLIKAIKKQGGAKAAIAIDPETSPANITQYLNRLDEVLLLGVTPGKQGQKFDLSVLQKINYIKNFREDIRIGIDGGVNDKNIKQIISAGADRAYIGSFLWSKGLNESMRILSELIQCKK